MYLTNESRTYYSRTGNQHSSRGKFLILMQDETKDINPQNFRAIVRKVALEQFGHWMMGTARIKNVSITMCGAYGNNGLPVSVPTKVFEMGVDVPKHLYDLWNDGGGWNSCGSEVDEMRKWAIETFKLDRH